MKFNNILFTILLRYSYIKMPSHWFSEWHLQICLKVAVFFYFAVAL